MWLTLVLSGHFLVSGEAEAQLGPKLLTIDEGREAIRRREVLRDTPVLYRGLTWGKGRRYSAPTGDFLWPAFVFATPEDNENYTPLSWTVDPYTGQVLSRTDVNVYRRIRDASRSKASGQRALTREGILAIAKGAVAERDPTFDPAAYHCYVSPLGNRPSGSGGATQPASVEVRYRSTVRIDGTECSPGTDTARVRIDLRTGKVALVVRLRYPLSVPLVPGLPRDQAVNIALRLMRLEGVGYAKALSARVALYSNASFPDCNVLCWSVGLVHAPAETVRSNTPTEVRGQLVTIEAHTGAILGSTWYSPDTQILTPSRDDIAAFARIEPLAERPLRVQVANHLIADHFCYPPPTEREGAFYVRPTFAWLCGVRVTPTDNGYSLVGVAESNVGPGEVIEREGEVLFPLSAVAEASLADVKWDPERRVLAVLPTYPELGESAEATIRDTAAINAGKR